MERRVAVLSNVNMDYVIRLLGREFTMLAPEGYGNELERMLNPESSYRAFAPQVTFLVMDLMELLEHDLSLTGGRIENWFSALRSSLQPGQEYFVSDAYLWGPELAVLHDPDFRRKPEAKWQEALDGLCADFPNVHQFPYRRLIEALGEENAFSRKMWYLGKIPYSGEAQKRLAELIRQEVYLSAGRSWPSGEPPKKVLLLDLDNTLWGGLAGEADHKPIQISEDHEGLAYKNLQRVIALMQKQGVILGIVSKNNEEDAMEILSHHPHCVLRPDCFAIRRINWEPKHENIRSIAEELNLGLDSMVFWDDQAAERELVSRMLPQVTVPDFPDKPEELAQAMAGIYRNYFQRLSVTGEDLEKTKQYQDNAKRSAMEASMDYESFLRQLQMQILREDPAKNLERLVQLVNKTNQFNLTTRRYELAAMQKILTEETKKVFLYRVKDCFGDNGIVAAVIVDMGGSGEEVPMVEEFVMSCRVMGRQIEYALAEDVENQLKAGGVRKLQASYLPTAKNKPVEQFYEKLGYQILKKNEKGEKEYEIDLANRPKRVYYAKIEEL